MSSNVGLSTPRGSGTSGYVQRNLSVLKPRATGTGAPYSHSSSGQDPHNRPLPPRHRKPDADILRHDRLRAIENAVLALRDTLEDAGEDDDDTIDEKCDNLRAKLISEMDENRNNGGRHGRDTGRGGSGAAGADGPGVGAKAGGRDGIKKYQVHELAEAKIRESDRLRRALGLKGDEIGAVGAKDGQDRNAQEEEHPMARQERRRKERELERARIDLEKSEQELNSRERENDRGGDRDGDRRRDRDRERGREWDRDRD